MTGRGPFAAAWLLAALACAAAMVPSSAAPETGRETGRASGRDQDTATRIWMRNVVMFPYDNAPATVSRLSGTAVPTRAGRPIDMDDVTSYAVEVRHAEMHMPAATMQALMNQYILPSADTAIKRVTVSFGDGTIEMRGTMRKLGLPIGFTATAVASPTPQGEMRITIVRMKAAGFIPKSFMDAIGLKMSKVAQPDNRQVFRIVGDTMIMPVSSMFPPPKFLGPLKSVRVTPQGMDSVVGRGTDDMPAGLRTGAHVHMRGGQVNFGRLTMARTDLTMVPKGDAGSLGFSPRNYYRQLSAGYSISQPDFGLVGHVADYRTLARPASAEQNRSETKTYKK